MLQIAESHEQSRCCSFLLKKKTTHQCRRCGGAYLEGTINFKTCHHNRPCGTKKHPPGNKLTVTFQLFSEIIFLSAFDFENFPDLQCYSWDKNTASPGKLKIHLCISNQ